MSKVTGTLLTIVFAYGGFCLLIFLFQSRMVYFPIKGIQMTPKGAGLEFEEIFFMTPDDTAIYGWFLPFQGSRKVILFCHGNAGNISHRLDSIRIFHDLGFNVFIFDYRGYGRSPGKPTEEGTYMDVEGGWKFLIEKKGFNEGDIVLFGRSLGGAVASWLAQKKNPAALIVESAFSSIPNLGARLYWFLPVRLLSRFSYSTVDYISRSNCPVLVIHSRDDETIPFGEGEKIYHAACKPKKMLLIYGDHNGGFLLSGSVYKQGLTNFLSEMVVF